MKNVDHMTPEQYRRALERLQLSQLGAARLFGVAPRTSRRWAALDEEIGAPIPKIAVRFIRYIIATKKTGEQVRRKLEE
jgi:hypothetical protein